MYVDGDTGQSISLVHILEMRIVQKDGTISEPMVTKHWRQDWRYEPTQIVEYQGRERWERRKVDRRAGEGAWLQTVYQVDESPRYASIGRWQHSASFSTWLSGETWRPLPRREWSVRDDYQVLVGSNRHTIAPHGWQQEENNLKTVLTPRATSNPRARMSRASMASHATSAFAMQTSRLPIATTSARASSGTKCVTAGMPCSHRRRRSRCKGPVDKLGLFQPLFEQADAIAEQGATASARHREIIDASFRNMGALD